MKEMGREHEQVSFKFTEKTDLIKGEIRQYVEAVQRLDERCKKKERDNAELQEEEVSRRDAYMLEKQMKDEIKVELLDNKEQLQITNDKIRQLNEQHDKMVRLPLEDQ